MLERLKDFYLEYNEGATLKGLEYSLIYSFISLFYRHRAVSKAVVDMVAVFVLYTIFAIAINYLADNYLDVICDKVKRVFSKKESEKLF